MNIDYKLLTIGFLIFEYSCFKLGQFISKDN